MFKKKKKEKGFHIKELNNASHTDNIKWVGAKELKIGFKKNTSFMISKI